MRKKQQQQQQQQQPVIRRRKKPWHNSTIHHSLQTLTLNRWIMHGYIIILFQALNSSGFSVEGAVTAAFTVPQCQVCQHTKSYTYPLYPSARYTSKHMPTHKILHIPVVPQCQVYQQTHANTQNLTHTYCTPVPGMPTNTCQYTKSYRYPS